MLSKTEIRAAAAGLRAGKLVAFPTETVYGLGANALDPMAVAKIFEMKERPSFDPLIVHLASLDALWELTSSRDSRIKLLAKAFWPGPLSIVLPKSLAVPDIVTSGLETVGLRIPDNAVALELIQEAGCPVAAPSANKFGQLSPTSAAHVRKQLPDLEFILDGGRTHVGIESTIISLNDKGFEILRHGIITQDELERFLPFHAVPEGEKRNLVAPGMLKSHYSPQKPIYISGTVQAETLNRQDCGFLSFSGADSEGYKYIEVVSRNHDIKEYAVNLFAAIHRLEELDCRYIVAEAVPETGIGLAIMDKLRKASHRYLV